MDERQYSTFIPRPQLHFTLDVPRCSNPCCFCILYFARARNGGHQLLLPPGPPGDWDITSLSSFASLQTLESLVEEYGPVFTLRSGSKVVVIIGRRQAAVDVMEKEGTALVDRPRWTAASEMVSGGMKLLLLQSGERLRRFRKKAWGGRGVMTSIRKSDPKTYTTTAHHVTVLVRSIYRYIYRSWNSDFGSCRGWQREREPIKKSSQCLLVSRVSTITLLALPILATATAVVPRDGVACSASGTAQCCATTQSPTSGIVQSLLGLLGIPIGSITDNVGLTCSPITVLGLGSTQCSNQVVCCYNNNFNGVIALGCTPINIGL
ncbi:hydrophobin-domain-containing protein [Armillaria gallica]|uniref:Hydrophobin-domain-containing protein n=1 Tax=Armillaria gallica TaxID=47427 RepID=A0A2H3CLX8_ARMGA|nr:hydrophobin-domain-containing protein [Armillaria gallica]